MLSRQVHDVIAATRAALADAAAPASAEAVRALPPLVRFSGAMQRAERAAQALPAAATSTAIRRSSRRPTGRARSLPSCSPSTSAEPAALPQGRGRHAKRHRAIADYIAGMTDRFALREHQRLTGETLFP